MKILDELKIDNVLFLDIETVPQAAKIEYVDKDTRVLWEKKSSYFRENEGLSLDESWNKAGIFAEFGKIVCISVGFVNTSSGKPQWRSKSFYGHDEKVLLGEFIALMNTHFNTQKHLLCAHNGKEFDFPFIARRILINGLKLPLLLDIAGKKPWEVHHLDTMELWKFGDRKNFTSVSLLTKIFNIPTPKDDIDGSMVGQVYWVDSDLERIETYCRKDVLAVAQLIMRMSGKPLLKIEENAELN